MGGNIVNALTNVNEVVWLKQYLDDCIEMLRFSVSWMYDEKAKPLFITIAGVILVVGLLFLGSIFIRQPLLAFLFLLIGGILFAYVVLMVLPFALSKRGFKPIEYGPISFIKSILVMIVTCIGVFLPWFDIRLLVLNVLIVLALVGVVLISIFAKVGFGFLLLFPIMLVGFLSVFYSSLRLAFSMYAFFDGNGVLDAVKKSWEITNGKMTRVYSRIWLTHGFAYGATASIAGIIVLPIYFLAIIMLFVNPQVFFVLYLLMMGIMFLVGVPIGVLLYMHVWTSAYAMLKPPEGAPVAGPVAPDKPTLGAPAAPGKPAKPAAKRMAK